MQLYYEALDPIARTPGTSFRTSSDRQGESYTANIPVFPFQWQDGRVSEFADVVFKLTWATDPNTHVGVINYNITTLSNIDYALVLWYQDSDTFEDFIFTTTTISVDQSYNWTNGYLKENGLIGGTIVPLTRDYADFNGDGWDQGYESGYQNGYKVGYQEGVVDGSVTESSVGSLMTSVFKGVEQVLSIEVVPNVSVGTIISIPIVLSLLLFLIKMIRS